MDFNVTAIFSFFYLTTTLPVTLTKGAITRNLNFLDFLFSSYEPNRHTWDEQIYDDVMTLTLDFSLCTIWLVVLCECNIS